MSAKERALTLLRGMPDDVSGRDIVSQLAAGLQSVGAEDYDDGELSADEWMGVVAHGLRDELADPREDIYTLDDGVPPDDAR